MFQSPPRFFYGHLKIHPPFFGKKRSRVFEIGYSGDDQVSYLQEGVLEALGLNLAGLDELMSELESDFMDLSGFSS